MSRYIKHSVTAFLLIAALFLMTACGKSTIANPLEEMTQDELFKETGIALNAIEGTDDIKYFCLSPSETSDNKIAQLTFMVGDYELTYRAQATEEAEAYDMSGLNFSWDTQKDVRIRDYDAKLNKCSEAAAVYWLDTEKSINYTLGCVGDIDEGQLEGLAGLLCDQGKENPEEDDVLPEPYDYAGTYHDDKDNEIIFTRNEDGTYNINIVLYELCNIEGTASDMDGAAEFSMVDPNGQDMTGIFYINEDGTYSCRFTGSTWQYIKTDDVYDGFIRNKQ